MKSQTSYLIKSFIVDSEQDIINYFFPSNAVVSNKYLGFKHIFMLLYTYHFTVQFFVAQQNFLRYLPPLLRYSYVPPRGMINTFAEEEIIES